MHKYRERRMEGERKGGREAQRCRKGKKRKQREINFALNFK